MNETVSVIVAAYNGEKYIEEMLESIWNQTYRPIQLIISDDCSTDQSMSIIYNWSRERTADDFKIDILRKRKNTGLSANVSGAVKKVAGEYLCIADQDDIWRSDKIERQVEYLYQNPDCIMCLCDRAIIDAQGHLLYKSEDVILNNMVRKRNLKMVLQNPSIYSANCMCLRSSCIGEIFPIPQKMIEHDTYIASMAAHYGNIGYLYKPLVKYRIHDTNVSGPDYVRKKVKRNFIRSYKKCVKRIRRYNLIVKNDDKILRDILWERYREDLFSIRKEMRKPVRRIYIKSLMDTLDQYIRAGMKNV